MGIEVVVEDLSKSFGRQNIRHDVSLTELQLGRLPKLPLAAQYSIVASMTLEDRMRYGVSAGRPS